MDSLETLSQRYPSYQWDHSNSREECGLDYSEERKRDYKPCVKAA